MKKIKLNCAATMEETFSDFLTSRKAKGLLQVGRDDGRIKQKVVAGHHRSATAQKLEA